MAVAKSSNPYESRTKLAAILAIIGGLCLLALIVGVFRRFDFTEFVAPYRQNSIRFFGILGSFGAGILCSGAGFFLALNCAGQKRNPMSKLAWQMFFLHALIVTLTLCTMILFYFTHDEVVEAAGGK